MREGESDWEREYIQKATGASEDELAQWVETIRDDVRWAAHSYKYTGLGADPASAIRGIIAMRARGLGNDGQAHWLILELDDHLADFKAEWQSVREEDSQ